jgi:hypothetical protein
MSFHWHCFYNQYSNIVFFQIQAERELIKWLLLPVVELRLLFSKIASVFEHAPERRC